MISGTAYFVSLGAAINYYLPYVNCPDGIDRRTTEYQHYLTESKTLVSNMIQENSISIGKPTLSDGQKLLIRHSEGRYIIED